MKQPVFEGTGVALATPFRDHHIDLDALASLLHHVLDGGVDFLVVLGTTGEAITLTQEECQRILRFVRQEVAERVPLVAGLFGGNNTARLTESFRHFDLEGYSAVMSSSPSYNKPTQRGIYQHYLAVAEASPLPIIIYNVPGRTASNVKPTTILRLAEASAKFIAVKEASGDLGQATTIAKNKPDHFTLLSGDDPLTLPMLACGGRGVISVIGNAFPTHFSGMVRAALQNNWEEARRLHFELWDLHPLLYVDGNPAGIKAALNILGICSGEVRLPLLSMQEKNYLKLKELIDQIPAYKPVRT